MTDEDLEKLQSQSRERHKGDIKDNLVWNRGELVAPKEKYRSVEAQIRFMDKQWRIKKLAQKIDAVLFRPVISFHPTKQMIDSQFHFYEHNSFPNKYPPLTP